MDIKREGVAEAKRKRRIIYGAILVAVIALVSLGLYRLEPAAPSVDAATVWRDTVKRGEMLRQVRGPGTLVPEEIRRIALNTAAIALFAGTLAFSMFTSEVTHER